MDSIENTVEVECISLQYGEGFSIAGHEDQVFAIVGVQDEASENEVEEEESEHDGEDDESETTPASNKRTRAPHWPTEVTSTLITTRLSKESDFSRGTVSRQLWRDIAATMLAHGYQVTAAECLSKWKNLLSTYRKTKERAERGGEHSVSWEHFEQLHAAFGQFAQELPPAGYLRASTSAGLRSTGWSVDRFVEAAASAKMRLGTSVAATLSSAALQVAECVAPDEAPCPPPVASASSDTSPISAATATSVDTVVHGPSPRSRIGKKRQTVSAIYNSPPKWLKEAIRHSTENDERRATERDQMWAEFRHLEQRKTDAMARLVAAAARLRDKSGCAGDAFTQQM